MFFLSKLADFYKDWKGDKKLKEKLANTYHDLLHEFQEMKEKLKDLEKANYELGIYHLKNNDISDALLRFNLLELFKCKRPGLFYYIAHCYMDQFKYAKAEKYINLYYQSDDKEFIEEINYFRLLIAKQEINTIPLSLVADKFDQLVKNFEKNNIVKNSTAQLSIANTLIKSINNSSKLVGNDILDIGCGNGSIGQILREERLANAIVGIDISKKMIELSEKRMFEKKKVYSKLIHGDAIHWLANHKTKEKYDIILLADFINFYSDIANLIKLLKEISHEKTIFGLSLIKSKKADVEFVHKFGEFRYNPEFVKSCFNCDAWKITSEENITFYEQNNGILLFIIRE